MISGPLKAPAIVVKESSPIGDQHVIGKSETDSPETEDIFALDLEESTGSQSPTSGLRESVIRTIDFDNEHAQDYRSPDHSPVLSRPKSRDVTSLRETLLRSSGYLGHLPIQTEEEVDKKYEFLECLGDGATASVRKGKNLITGEYVAIKIIPVERLKYNKSITREVNILKNLDHPNIVKLLDVSLTGSNLYIVMELAAGKPLFDYILDNKHNYTENKVRSTVQTILKAIAYLHSKGISHRDLKPENLVFASDDPNAELKLVDFGLARVYHSGEGFRTPTGTLGYKAPEIFRSEQYDMSVDMWSLGVITYILLCGFPPFFSKKEYQENENLLRDAPFWLFFNDNTDLLKQQIMQGKINFPDPFWTCVSNEAREFVSKLLKVDPHDRLTAEQALQDTWIVKGGTIKSKAVSLDSAVTIMHLSSHYTKQRAHTDDEVDFSSPPTTPEKSARIDISPRASRLEVPSTPTTHLISYLKMRPSLGELLADHVIKPDYLQRLYKETRKRQTE